MQRVASGGFGCPQSAYGQLRVAAFGGWVVPSAAPNFSACAPTFAGVSAAVGALPASAGARSSVGPATLASAKDLRSEKSTPASEAPQTHRARSGGFSISQTGQMRT